MPPLSATLAAILGLQVICTDLYARRVSNRWLLAAAAAALASSLFFPALSTAFGAALTGLLLGLALLLPFHALGWMGAGDVKFFSILGLLLGGKALIPLWIIASLLAGLHALAWTIIRTHPVPGFIAASPPAIRAYTFINESGFFIRMKASRKGRKGIPYAAYLGIATILVVFTGVSHG